MKTLIMLAIVAAIYQLAKRRAGASAPAPPPRDWLDTPLLYWSEHDDFTIRDLVRSVSIMGAAGSGKTSSVGYQLGKALAANPRIGGLIIASKPEDRAMWRGILGDRLIVFGPGEKHRFNFIDHESQQGADARELTDAITTTAESLTRAEGGDSGDKFWKEEARRQLHNAIEPLLQANGKVNTWDIQEFITDAPLSREELMSPAWQSRSHYKVMDAAGKKPKSTIAAHDFDLAQSYWSGEYPDLNDRTRTSILAHTMGKLHVFNAGNVRELIGTGTTISPQVFEEGKWVLVDMPIANYGVGGAFVAGAWKYATQRHVLRRKATAETPVTCLWIDEYQNHITGYDAKYLAEDRSHLGCMIVLTQSMHSFFSSIGGREAHSHTKALLTNFGTKIFMTLGDDESAQYAASLIGRGILHLGSGDVRGNIFDQLERAGSGYHFSEHFEQLLQNGMFMHGLRTGGPENDYIAEGWVVRNGMPFSSGLNWMKVGFSQK